MWDSSSRPSYACTATDSLDAPPSCRPWPQPWVAPPSCCPWPTIEIMELLGIIPVTYLEMSGIFPHSSKLCVLGLSSQKEIHLQGNTESMKLNIELCLPPSYDRFLVLRDKQARKTYSLSGKINPSHRMRQARSFTAGGRENSWISR